MRKHIKITVIIMLTLFIITGLVYYNIIAIQQGEFDYSLIRDGMPPKYAKEYATAFDGGTTWYRGIGYSIYAVHSMHLENEVEGYLVGPRIQYYFFIFGGKNRESLHFKSRFD
ncbi:MAG: hypothetical protein WBC05_24080 [Sedimentisphaerales bacterium]